MSRAARIDRLEVIWRPDAEPDATGRLRLDGLVCRLVDSGLADGLATDADRDVDVCVRRVTPPVHRMRWDAPDGEVVSDWGGVVGRAVAEAVAAGGADVVRFASRTHARLDLVTALLRGDRRRVWAWRMLGLWPGGAGREERSGGADGAGEPAAHVLRHVLVEVGRDEPAAAVGLLVATARDGHLPRFVSVAGPELVVGLVGAAWRAAGGFPEGVDGAAWACGPADACVRFAGRGDPQRAGPEPVVAAADAVVDLCALVAARSVVLRAGTGVQDRRPASPSWLGSLAGALAAAAVLEVEPALAGRPVASDVVRALASSPADPGSSESARPWRSSRGGRSHLSPIAGTAAAVARAEDGVFPDIEPDPVGLETAHTATVRLPARTGWGGLLFLLPLLDEVELPARVAADPERYGQALRPVLHELACSLVTRAVPDAGPAEPTDPALLAFAGLAPDAEPPRRTAAEQTTLESEADAVVAALRARLDSVASDRALLLAVCRRRAVIEVDPGWIDVLLEFDEVSVDVRRAGLDLDPGYLPWLGCVVRYRYG